MKNIGLMGAGAVGAYFIRGLAKKEEINFFVIAKEERKQRLEKEGLIINGEVFYFSVKEPEEIEELDLLLISCKYDALEELMEDIKIAVKEDTAVISLLNGVTSEEIIGREIGQEHLLYSVMRISSERKGNQISFLPEKTAGIFLGEKDSRVPTERIKKIEELFQNTGIRYNFVEDIIREIWLKYASNVSQNLPQAILNVGYQAYIDSPYVSNIASRLWREVVTVAKAKGIFLPEEFTPFSGVSPKARFSTLQDLDAGRHTEIEMFAGDMIRMGKELDIPVPFCEYTYDLIKALEEKNDGLI